MHQLLGTASVRVHSSDCPAPSITLPFCSPLLSFLSSRDILLISFFLFSLSLCHLIRSFHMNDIKHKHLAPPTRKYLKFYLVSLFWSPASFLTYLKTWKFDPLSSVASAFLIISFVPPHLLQGRHSPALWLLQFLLAGVEVWLSFILCYLFKLLYPNF